MKVAKWISKSRASGFKVSVGWPGGFFMEGMRWDDYINHFPRLSTKEIKYLLAIRDEVIEKKIRINGYDHHRDQFGIPLFEDNTVGDFSPRAWADLMAAIWSDHENKDYAYGYFLN